MFRHLMLATDFSSPALIAAQAAASLAHRLGAKVTIMHAYGSDLAQDEVERRREGLRFMKDERFAQVEKVDLHLVESDAPDEAIAEAARSWGVDLIVAARHGKQDFKELLIGSTTERLVRKAPCSMLVVHPAKRERIAQMKHVMVGTDFSDASTIALSAARALGDTLEAWVTLVHVYDLLPVAMELMEEPFAEGDDHSLAKMMNRKLEELREQHFDGVSSEAMLIRDKSTVAALCDEASERDVDIMVVGTHGRTGLTRFFLGSVAERVVRHAPCSVLVAQDGERVSAAAELVKELGGRVV